MPPRISLRSIRATLAEAAASRAPGIIFVLALRHAGFVGKLEIRLSPGPIRAWPIAFGLAKFRNDLFWRVWSVPVPHQCAGVILEDGRRRLRPLLAQGGDDSVSRDGREHKYARKHVREIRTTACLN